MHVQPTWLKSVEHVNNKLGSSYIECRFSLETRMQERAVDQYINVMNMHTG